jgi:DNA-binding MarR family transcriptional regulator
MSHTVPVDPLVTIRSLHSIGHHIDVVFDRLLQAEFGLTLSRYRILVPLIELGPSTQSTVAKFNFVTEASIGRQVRLLVADGFLKQIPCNVDARKSYLTVTKKTELLIPKIMARLSEEVTALYGDMSASEFTILDALLGKLLRLGQSNIPDTVTCTN